jgi:putative transposase
MLQQAFRVVAHDEGAFTHAVGGMLDHVHVAVSIPPTMAVSTYVQRLKGSSSHYINKALEFPELDGVTWQRGFNVDTFSKRALPDVVSYIEHQAERHANNDLWRAFEELPPR